MREEKSPDDRSDDGKSQDNRSSDNVNETSRPNSPVEETAQSSSQGAPKDITNTEKDAEATDLEYSAAAGEKQVADDVDDSCLDSDNETEL